MVLEDRVKKSAGIRWAGRGILDRIERRFCKRRHCAKRVLAKISRADQLRTTDLAIMFRLISTRIATLGRKQGTRLALRSLHADAAETRAGVVYNFDHINIAPRFRPSLQERSRPITTNTRVVEVEGPDNKPTKVVQKVVQVNLSPLALLSWFAFFFGVVLSSWHPIFWEYLLLLTFHKPAGQFGSDGAGQ